MQEKKEENAEKYASLNKLISYMEFHMSPLDNRENRKQEANEETV